MKLSPSRIEAFVARPDPAARVVLVYGPDSGLVRERAERLCRTVVEDLGDPFRVVELSVAQLRAEPARLPDEAAQIAMIGGRRVVRIRDAVDSIAPAVEGFLDKPTGDALVVIEAGELAARAKLRVLCEGSDSAAAVPCYADDEETVTGLVRATLRQAKLSATGEALEYLVAHLGGDRLMTRRELEKLVLYMGAGGSQVRLEDAEACIGDSAAHSIDDAILAAAEGDMRTVGQALGHAFAEGESAVAVVRSAQRYFQRLHFCTARMAAGESADRVIESLKPRLFWKLKPRFRRQLDDWSPVRAAQALERLTAAEIACKSTGMPDEAVATRCLLELAGMARRRQRSA
jgi:DNA polymerase-3 subunit delta